MSNYGIISEFNPFHNGHSRIIKKAKELGAERVVAIMSGNAVQRGELAVLDKYVRAEAALRAGADLVLELPFPWCASSAEYFASAGTYIASDFCTDLIFGSECGDINTLKKCAQIALEKDFREEFTSRTEKGERAAKAYFDMLSDKVGAELRSNDILGIEYMRAAMKNGYGLNFHTVKREGLEYNEQELRTDRLPSAAALRKLWKDEGVDKSKQFIPDEAFKCFENEIKIGGMTDTRKISEAVLMYFRLKEGKDFANIAECEGGIANRICSLARSSVTLEQLLAELSTKRYTDAKMRRCLLFCLCGVTKDILADKPCYVTLLAANEKGRELLKELRKKEKIAVVTKPADAPKDSLQYKLSRRLDAVFTLASSKKENMLDAGKKGAFIL